MSASLNLDIGPGAVDPSDVQDFVNDHLRRTGRLDCPLSETAYAALFRHSDGNRHLLLSLSGLAVFLARLESANRVESRHVDAAALSRSEVELTDRATSIVTADAEAKLVASKFGQGTCPHWRLHAAVTAAMMACLAIGLAYALSSSRPATPALGGLSQGIDITVAGNAEPAVASAQSPAAAPPDQPTSSIEGGAAAKLSAFPGGGFGEAMLAPIRPVQQRTATIRTAMPPSKAGPSAKGAPPVITSFAPLQVGRN